MLLHHLSVTQGGFLYIIFYVSFIIIIVDALIVSRFLNTKRFNIFHPQLKSQRIIEFMQILK